MLILAVFNSAKMMTKQIQKTLYLKCPKITTFLQYTEVRSSDFEVRVRPVFFGISLRCSKFGHAKVRVFEVRTFWVRSNTNFNIT